MIGQHALGQNHLVELISRVPVGNILRLVTFRVNEVNYTTGNVQFDRNFSTLIFRCSFLPEDLYSFIKFSVPVDQMFWAKDLGIARSKMRVWAGSPNVLKTVRCK